MVFFRATKSNSSSQISKVYEQDARVAKTCKLPNSNRRRNAFGKILSMAISNADRHRQLDEQQHTLRNSTSKSNTKTPCCVFPIKHHASHASQHHLIISRKKTQSAVATIYNIFVHSYGLFFIPKSMNMHNNMTQQKHITRINNFDAINISENRQRILTKLSKELFKTNENRNFLVNINQLAKTRSDRVKRLNLQNYSFMCAEYLRIDMCAMNMDPHDFIIHLIALTNLTAMCGFLSVDEDDVLILNYITQTNGQLRPYIYSVMHFGVINNSDVIVINKLKLLKKHEDVPFHVQPNDRVILIEKNLFVPIFFCESYEFNITELIHSIYDGWDFFFQDQLSFNLHLETTIVSAKSIALPVSGQFQCTIRLSFFITIPHCEIVQASTLKIDSDNYQRNCHLLEAIIASFT